MTTKRAAVWNEYRNDPYTHDVSRGKCPKSTQGSHVYQVRRSGGTWQTRLVQSNGRHRFVVGPFVVSDKNGEAIFSRVS